MDGSVPTQDSTECHTDMCAGVEMGKLTGLRVPMLAVQALDDPIISPEGAPTDQSALDKIENLFMMVTR